MEDRRAIHQEEDLVVQSLLEDYWNEFKLIEEQLKPPAPAAGLPPHNNQHQRDEEECREEREWLESVGLGGVVEAAWAGGRPVTEAELSGAVSASALSAKQAAAVHTRIQSVNNTISLRAHRHRHRNRPRKPDIRHLFADPEAGWSSGADSRSRSATPDSLDSDEPPSPPSIHNLHYRLHPSGSPGSGQRNDWRRRVVGVGGGGGGGGGQPGASSPAGILSHQALFRRATRSGSDIVASETADGITMVGYQRIGSLRVRERTKSESDPLSLNTIQPGTSPPKQHSVVCVTRSHDSLLDSGQRRHHHHHRHHSHSDHRKLQNNFDDNERAVASMGFEQLWATSLSPVINNEMYSSWHGGGEEEDGGCGKTRVDFLAEEDLTTLRPLLFVELTAIMDRAGLRVGKLKPIKRKRKEDGILFGLSLATLLEKDQQIVVEPHSVPLVFQKVLGELSKRGVYEEGVLRIGGNKQRVEALCAQLEKEFYTRPEVADHLISSAATVHELSTILKRLIRMMPQPLLTTHLLHLFYQSHGVADCVQALNLLVLLLPSEHRATLHAVLSFLARVVAHQDENKMSAHNVATIMAPSLFPADVLVAKSGLKAELGVAVQCCRLMELMMTAGDGLWLVPDPLVAQLRRINQNTRKENNGASVTGPPPGAESHRPLVVQLDRYDNNNCGAKETVLVRIEAPQFLPETLSVAIDKRASVGDVILRIVEMSLDVPRCVKSTKRDIKARALSELAPNGNLSCLLSTGDPDTALQTHFLYEVGGNIGQRRLEAGARLAAIYKNNPNAQFVIKCDHRNGSHRNLKPV